MFYCDKCNTILAMDYKHTSIYYNDNVTTILDEDGTICYDALPDEVVYICHKCGAKKLVALSELVNMIKTKVCRNLLSSRLGTVYKLVDKNLVDEAHGIDFCGRCFGVIDDSGYCYKDVIKKCPVRKLLNDKEHFTKRGEYKE